MLSCSIRLCVGHGPSSQSSFPRCRSVPSLPSDTGAQAGAAAVLRAGGSGQGAGEGDVPGTPLPCSQASVPVTSCQALPPGVRG